MDSALGDAALPYRGAPDSTAGRTRSQAGAAFPAERAPAAGGLAGGTAGGLAGGMAGGLAGARLVAWLCPQGQLRGTLGLSVSSPSPAATGGLITSHLGF